MCSSMNRGDDVADIKGDNSKRSLECKERDGIGCPNIKSRETWSSETRWCDVCGERYTLYDDEMK